jgi:hypothetical protein
VPEEDRIALLPRCVVEQGHARRLLGDADTVLPVTREATDGGRLPAVCDASSCTEGIVHLLEVDGVDHLDDEARVGRVARHVLRYSVSAASWSR